MPSAAVPIMTDPDPSIRPDLVALPAWGISIDHQGRSNRDFLDFGATVWDKGPSPMVVEGFRRPGEPIMDGWEYFYSNGEPVGRNPKRISLWEIHPIYKFEVCTANCRGAGRWQSLTRWLANQHRAMAGRVLGTPIPPQYRPHRSGGAVARLVGWASDPMTWRDQAWLVASCTMGLLDSASTMR